MTQDAQMEIPLSRKKMTMTFLGSIVFVGIGVWFLINPPKISNPILGNPTVIFIVGLASVFSYKPVYDNLGEMRRLQVSFFKFLNSMVNSPGCYRHKSKRWILGTGGCHAGTICYEYVFARM